MLTYLLSGIKLRTGTKPRLWRKRIYYIKFYSAGTARSTKETKDGKDGLSWDENFLFDGNDKDDFRVEVYQRHRFPRKRDELVVSLTSTFEDVVTKVNNNVFEESLRKDPSMSDDSSEAKFTLKFTFITAPHQGHDTQKRQADCDIGKAIQAAGAMHPTLTVVDPATSAVDEVPQLMGSVQTFETTWNVLLQRIELLSKISASIAQIHPYVSLAWFVVSSVNQILVKQKNCDDQVIRLAGTMSDVFAFVHDTNPLKTIEEHVEPLKLLIQQVMECADFIRDYAEHKGFVTRMVTSTFANVDTRISDYQSKLHELRDAFVRGITLQTRIIVGRLHDMVDDGADKIEISALKDLPYADGARHDQTKGCLPGTRETLLREIFEILNNPADDAPRVCLLIGVAGSGKSAVAHSIARWADVVSRNPNNLFSTIARDLADRDHQYRSALCKVIQASRSLRTSRVPMEQLEQLIIEPSKDVRPIGPLVIVIDALDECGDQANRQHLLPALSRLITDTSFPTNLRFLITTRPENDILDDILDQLPSDPRLVCKEMGDILKQSVDADIERFIHHSLDKYSSELQLVDQDWCRLLVQRAQHLFQWAATACNFIREIGSSGLGRSDRVRLLLETDKIEGGYPLDQLYRTVLRQLFESEPERDRFREVMAIVLALKKPLPLPSLSALIDGHLRVPVDPIRPLHTSFYDFLRDGKSSFTFQIPLLPQNSLTLGQASLACMRHMLKFNICGLTDPRILNTVVPDLSSRVGRAIPPHLSYSCLYWMDHLQHVQCTPDQLDDITLFFKTFFPYWVEAISLLSLSSASPILSALETCTILEGWAQPKEQSITILASEASRFIQVFAPVFRKSTPHLYLFGRSSF
ncbi:hypothetical protein JVU11DRAFT_4461 [Chiua virens]|nr:hypothetical protein JVU11DRAFT_4461 [Chiua virens]